MPRELPYVDPHAHRGSIYRAFVGLLSTGPMTSLSRTRIWGAVIWRLDRLLLRLTGGRVGTGLLLRTALLETRGAKTGRERRTAVIYFHDADRVTIIASHAGRPTTPSWFYNLAANPEVRFGGWPLRAEIVNDPDERDRLWALADRVFPAFGEYRRRAASAGRAIPIVQLVARDRDLVG